MSVVVLDELFDFMDKCFHTFERSSADGALGDEIEPDFDLIQP